MLRPFKLELNARHTHNNFTQHTQHVLRYFVNAALAVLFVSVSKYVCCVCMYMLNAGCVGVYTVVFCQLRRRQRSSQQLLAAA